jgi:hypothetical protein
MSSVTAITPIAAAMPERELARRRASDIDVALFWRPADGRLRVEATDLATGVTLIVPVADDPPLEVFAHPFFFASVRDGSARVAA